MHGKPPVSGTREDFRPAQGGSLTKRFPFHGHTFTEGEIFRNVRTSQTAGESFVLLPTGDPRWTLQAQLPEDCRVPVNARVSVRLTSISLGHGYPSVRCVLVESPDQVQPAAKPLTDLASVLADLGARIEKAGSAQEMVALVGNLNRAASRFSRFSIQPAIERWTAKAVGMIGFYCEAKEVLGWSREAVDQYGEMTDLLARLRTFQPPAAEALRLPGKYKGQLVDLARVGAWTSYELEQKKAALARDEETRLAREAAEKADRALAESKYRSKVNGLTALLADCQTGALLSTEAAAHLVQWLTHITRDEGGTFLGVYQGMSEACEAAPDITRGFLVYFKSVLARLAPPSA